MCHYGFEIVQTLIVDIEPDERVKQAMNEINAGKTYNYVFLLSPLNETNATGAMNDHAVYEFAIFPFVECLLTINISN